MPQLWINLSVGNKILYGVRYKGLNVIKRFFLFKIIYLKSISKKRSIAMTEISPRQLAFQSPLQLTMDQIAKLNNTSLEIMASTGLRFFDDEALALFKKAGATVTDNNLVTIDAKLVEWALKCAPKTIDIHDRNGDPAMKLKDGHCYYGVGSDCAYLYDLESGLRRQAKLKDVENGVRLVDALPGVDFAMSMVLPADVPLGCHEFYQMAAMVMETTKPIVFVGETLFSTMCAVEMASAVAGSEEALARAPFIINYVNTISAINHNKESVKRLLYAAERNLPTVYGPAATKGIIGPMTTAGSVAFGNAGQLAGLVLSQLKREGSPFIRALPGGETIDLRTMVDLYAAPDDGVMGWDLARDQHLPIFGTGGCSNSKVFDAQAVAEATLTLFTSTTNGSNLIHDMGYLDCAMTYSFELLMLCDEVVSWIKRFQRPKPVTDETLGHDFFEELKSGGNPLAFDHTLQHVRDGWQPSLFDRSNFDDWNKNGSKTFEERAREKVALIINTHKGSSLPDAMKDTLLSIRDRYSILDL
jgi:trimethylamine---corrinoid protein Co-methyltransferase